MADQPRDPETGRFISKQQAANEDDHRLTRLDFARRAGLQYGTDRDVYEVAGYEKHPDFEDYWSYYDRHPIAGRIIDLPPKTTWRNAPEITDADEEDEDPDTEFSGAVEALAENVQLWHRLERVDRLARIGEFAVLLIGVRDGGRDLAQPLSGLSEPEDVAYLGQFSQRNVEIQTFVEEPDDPRFGLPELYTIDLGRKNTDFQVGRVPVHWSRVVHIAEDLLEDEVMGRPALKRVLNTIFNDEKVDAASAEAFWQLADKVMQIKTDPDADLDDKTLDALGEALEEIYHDLRRQMVIEGGELSYLGGDTPDPSAVFNVLATKMAAGSGIPRRILFGSERGELASSQDERNWMGTISERQEQYAEPFVLRDLIDRLIDVGALPRPQGGDYNVEWPNLFEHSETEQAEIDKLKADTAKALTPAGGDPLDMIEIDEQGAITLRPSDVIREEREEMEPDLPPEFGPEMGDEETLPDEPSPNGDQPDEQEIPADLIRRRLD